MLDIDFKSERYELNYIHANNEFYNSNNYFFKMYTLMSGESNYFFKNNNHCEPRVRIYKYLNI